MDGAASIASHGRSHKVSGLGVGSFGRALVLGDGGSFFSTIRDARGHFSLCIEAADHIAVQVIPKSHITAIIEAIKEGDV